MLADVVALKRPSCCHFAAQPIGGEGWRLLTGVAAAAASGLVLQCCFVLVAVAAVGVAGSAVVGRE